MGRVDDGGGRGGWRDGWEWWGVVRTWVACWLQRIMVAWRDWRRRVRRWSEWWVVRPVAASMEAKRRKEERSQFTAKSGPRPERWVKTKEKKVRRRRVEPGSCLTDLSLSRMVWSQAPEVEV